MERFYGEGIFFLNRPAFDPYRKYISLLGPLIYGLCQCFRHFRDMCVQVDMTPENFQGIVAEEELMDVTQSSLN